MVGPRKAQPGPRSFLQDRTRCVVLRIFCTYCCGASPGLWPLSLGIPSEGAVTCPVWRQLRSCPAASCAGRWVPSLR